MEMETEIEPSTVNSDDEQDFVPKKAVNNYRSLLDSDSEEDENQKQNTLEVPQNKSESESENDEIADKSISKSRIVAQSSGSSDSEHEEAKTSPEKVVKGRRKNQNPKKKILPEKTQRVRLNRKDNINMHIYFN